MADLKQQDAPSMLLLSGVSSLLRHVAEVYPHIALHAQYNHTSLWSSQCRMLQLCRVVHSRFLKARHFLSYITYVYTVQKSSGLSKFCMFYLITVHAPSVVKGVMTSTCDTGILCTYQHCHGPKEGRAVHVT